MPAIPPTGDFPKATIDKDTFHAKFLAVHAYLTGLLGSDGVAATARAQLGMGSALTDIAAAAAAAAAAAVPLVSWPVGSIYISNDPANPSVAMGGGTWVAFGAGRVLVGFDAGQTEFDTVEETGGAKTHTLSTAEMPSHTHTTAIQNGNGGGGESTYAVGNGTYTNYPSSSAGSGGAHNNLQPYIVVHMWKRTA